MSPFLFGRIVVLTLAAASAIGAAAPDPVIPAPVPAEILRKVRPVHPRLLLDDAGASRLRQQVESDAVLRGWWTSLRANADDLLGQAPSRYEIPDGRRLLATSRRVLGRVYTLSLARRLTGDGRYSERAWRELEAAAQFKDWNPSHFLDTAEMTHAFAIGYDWLHSVWTPAQRAVLRQAMVEKGLKLGLESHRGGRYGWWSRSEHNWNQVCNGGIGMGALALADEEEALAGEFLAAALVSIQRAMRQYAPDGAWGEGPGYWNYATTYNGTFLAALESACGTDFGLGQIPGFSEAGMFPLHVTGPLGRTFNYADGGDGAIRAPVLFWLARRFDRPAYAAYQRRFAQPHPLDLVWGATEPPAAGAPLPLDHYFRGADVVTLRSAWEGRDALFVAFKGGDNRINHSNLDLGSFVLDALGERWVQDLGGDDYNLPGYFGDKRWTYYRLRAEGHNTLVINPGLEPDQDPKAKAPILKFDSTPARAFGVADLTAAYARQARRVQRGIALENRRTVRVQDEVETLQPAEVWWFMHTPATVTLSADGRVATLRRGDSALEARLLEPPGVRFSVLDPVPLPGTPHPPRQATNRNVRKLAIHVVDVRHLTLGVDFTPVGSGEAPRGDGAPLRPLAAW